MSPTGSNNWTGTFTVGAWARRGPWRIRSVCLHDLIGHQLLSTSNALESGLSPTARATRCGKGLDATRSNAPGRRRARPRVAPEWPTLELSHLQFEAMLTAG